jgi:hypothetical protein
LDAFAPGPLGLCRLHDDFDFLAVGDSGDFGEFDGLAASAAANRFRRGSSPRNERTLRRAAGGDYFPIEFLIVVIQ